YLELDRGAPTLSGGAAQRIRLAAQLGSNLQGVCYVLDEPTIGLHPRDNQILLASLAELAGQRNTLVSVEHDEETIRRAGHELDQTPIGQTPRSCPATYLRFWHDIRRIYAGTTGARIRGYTASRFLFNTAGGRCEACEGQGVKTIEMSFLPDVKVLCDVCGGRRFNSETLAVSWREASIGDVLAMSVDDAVGFFAAHARVHHALKLLQDVRS